MNIGGRVTIIGSGMTGVSLTHPLDCNVYLLDCGGEYALIDAGAGIDPCLILERIDELGIARKRITHLLLTHVHGDHAGGAAFLREALGAIVVCPAEAAPWLEHADKDKTSVGAAVEAGVYPENYRLPACPVDRAVKDNDALTIADVVLRVIDSPGHSRGHAAYLLDEAGGRAMFCGDAVFSGGRISLQNLWDCSIPEYARTMAKLYELRPDSLYPGHGPFLCREGWKPIESAHRVFERLGIPPNL